MHVAQKRKDPRRNGSNRMWGLMTWDPELLVSVVVASSGSPGEGYESSPSPTLVTAPTTLAEYQLGAHPLAPASRQTSEAETETENAATPTATPEEGGDPHRLHQSKLVVASPRSLQRATNKLSTISTNHLREIACFASSPESVRLLLQAVCDVGGFGERLTPKHIKSLLLTEKKSKRFIRHLQNTELHCLSADVVARVEDTYTHNRAWDVAEVKRRSSSVCGVLADWLLKMLSAARLANMGLLSPRDTGKQQQQQQQQQQPQTAPVAASKEEYEQYWRNATKAPAWRRHAEVKKALQRAQQRLAPITTPVLSAIHRMGARSPHAVQLCVTAWADVLGVLDALRVAGDHGWGGSMSGCVFPARYFKVFREVKANQKRLLALMQEFDIEQVTEVQLERWDAWYLHNTSFNVDAVAKANRECGLLAAWVHAIAQAARVYLADERARKKKEAAVETFTKKPSFGRVILQRKIPVTDLSVPIQQGGVHLGAKKQARAKKKAFSQRLDFSHVQARVDDGHQSPVHDNQHAGVHGATAQYGWSFSGPTTSARGTRITPRGTFPSSSSSSSSSTSSSNLYSSPSSAISRLRAAAAARKAIPVYKRKPQFVNTSPGSYSLR